MPGDLPEFRLPTCHDHFFKGHRWWCKKCDIATADEMKELAETYWRLQLSLQPRPDIRADDVAPG